LLALAEDRDRILGAEARGGAEHVALVGAVVDLARYAGPVLLEGVVALDDRLELEAERRVADLHAAQEHDAPIELLARDEGLELLDAEEVLLVKSPDALEAALEIFQGSFELGVFHAVRAPSP